MSCKCYKLVCIDFKITRWNFDIDSKVVEFLLQENEHTYTHQNPTVFARSLCPTLAHPVLHVAFAQTFCALTHNQCVLSSCVSKWIIDARTHFPGRKIQKFLYACSAQQTHNQRPPWTRPQPTYMYTARTTYEDGKFVSVCACMSLRMVTHTNITQNSIPVSTSTHWDNFHDVLLAATANFSNIQHTIWWTVFFALALKYLFGNFGSRSTLKTEWIETRCYERPMVFFATSLLYQIKFYHLASVYCLSYNMVTDDICHLNSFSDQILYDSWINKTENSESMQTWYIDDWTDFDKTSKQNSFFILCRGSRCRTLWYCTGSKRVYKTTA